MRIASIGMAMVMAVAISQHEAFAGLWHDLGRISGVSLPTISLKSADESVESGDIWIADLVEGTRRQVTQHGGYRSPVFEPDNQHLLALEGATLVRLATAGGEMQKLQSLGSTAKLVGVDKEDGDKVLVIYDEGEIPRIASVSVKKKEVTVIPYDPKSPEDTRLVGHLRGWRRVYGGDTLFQKREKKETMAGTVEWTDVYLKREEKDAANISKCGGANCGQPSMSHDGKHVVYIRQE
jgi:hypothetical protein